MNNDLIYAGFDLTKPNVIFHADDIGMYQSSISAFAQLCSQGQVFSGSLMAPCPWFGAAVQLQKKFPQADLGLHLTLTSEWDDYRWGPVSPVETQDGLVDDSGVYFHQRCAQVIEHASVAAVEKELIAQIELAKRLGFEPSHLDGHMFACQQPTFLPSLLKLSLEYQIPAVITHQQLHGLCDSDRDYWLDKLKRSGAPVFDQIITLELDADIRKSEDNLARVFSELPPGLYYAYAHPALPSGELTAITTQAEARVAEFNSLLNLDLQGLAQTHGINLCTFKTVTK